jgi:hypothetical protein
VPVLTPSERYEYECRDKRTFAQKADAKKALKRIMGEGGDAMRIYRCTSCLRFHLGHNKPKPSRQRATP